MRRKQQVEYRLIAIINGDEVFIGKSKNINELYCLAQNCVYELKYNTGYSFINFYIQYGWRIINQFTL